MIAFAGVAAFALLAAVVLVAAVVRRTAARVDERSVVRVVTPTTSGTGFFIADPTRRDRVLVVTAFHVVDSGAHATIERAVGGPEGFLEAYPETELVAFDTDSDLALLRIKNLPRNEVRPLDLAERPTRDAAIASLGYPANTLATRTGLVKKDGKLLDAAKLPVVNRTDGRVVRDQAVDGLLVSSDIEPGFSGGPTVDQRGRVVGVNVRQDPKALGQNGAVSVAVLKDLLGRVRAER